MSTSAVRVALVTGAAQGIGLSVALRLADDGLDVALNDIVAKSEQLQNVVSEIEAKGRRALAVPADVTSEEDVKSMVDRVVEELGGLDVMVANAGISLGKSFLETSVDEWERIMAVNVRGVMLSYKYAAVQMIKQGRGGRIIGACSTGGKQGYFNYSAYCTSKFAVRGLTQSTAQELRPYNITVNTYAPGVILTNLGEFIWMPLHIDVEVQFLVVTDHPDDAINGGPGSTAKKLAGLPPTTPHAPPEVVASIVSYIARPESYFITGQSIALNGGIYFD
ncbi:NAD-P-binding protein [Obba rivulosa]|uniref:NAD-P-binding protein n=1 Tax=Obba rivulosa TaxID=1052685 RepID=A0A8E2AZU0_9APHY|nr:NAD-P-binding protein [Obba rivulosa]